MRELSEISDLEDIFKERTIKTRELKLKNIDEKNLKTFYLSGESENNLLIKGSLKNIIVTRKFDYL